MTNNDNSQTKSKSDVVRMRRATLAASNRAAVDAMEDARGKYKKEDGFNQDDDTRVNQHIADGIMRQDIADDNDLVREFTEAYKAQYDQLWQYYAKYYSDLGYV